jgi:hypothetical protein
VIEQHEDMTDIHAAPPLAVKLPDHITTLYQS